MAEFQFEKKIEQVRQGYLLAARAILSLGRLTGCRGKSVIDMDIHSWSKVLDDNRLLCKYVTSGGFVNFSGLWTLDKCAFLEKYRMHFFPNE